MYLYYDPEILLLDIYPREIFSYSSLKIVVFKSICIAYLVLVGIRISQYLHFVKFFYILLLFNPSTSAVTDSLSPHRLWHTRLSCPSLSPEYGHTHVHWVSDAVQPSHLLSPSSFPALSLSQYQGLFQWVRSSHQVGKGLELLLQHQSFQWIFRVNFLKDWFGLIPLPSKGLSRIFSSTTVRKHQFFSAQPSIWSSMTTGKTIALTRWTFVGKVMSLLFNTVQVCHSFSSKEQASFKFMAAVTVCGDFGAKEKKVCHCFPFFAHLFTMKWWAWMPLL